ncbi:VWA domain-containing protein [Armatimonas sp.]|uniref:VWA domain-containing protein n=1 Tax=Armatimonas sp. TaxID=1872638 RepID=UPI00286AFB2F|nr:VWA domain-containing protein [Armatimonas sp.]
MTEEIKRKLRWRLVLGAGTEDLLGGLPQEGDWAEKEAALAYLYDREYGPGRNTRAGSGGAGTLDPSNLSVPDWINAIHELFPQRVIERIEKDGLERYGLEEMVTNPALLARAQPSQTLLRAVLRTKHLMNPEVLALARTLVQKVVQELLEKLATQVQSPFLGAPLRRRSYLKVAKNFDVATTLRRNLRHWDTVSQRLILKEPYFHSRIKRHVDKWQILIVVDQSGSMVGSVIHAAVTAAIFFGIPALKTRLILFDTSIVDVTDYCTDPVEILMKVQLGGGTDIGQALAYAESRVENPRRTIIVLITDFFEGADTRVLLGATKRLVESGVHLLGLAALDANANPTYDRELAGRMANLGAHIGAMTPGELAEWVGEKVK